MHWQNTQKCCVPASPDQRRAGGMVPRFQFKSFSSASTRAAASVCRSTCSSSTANEPKRARWRRRSRRSRRALSSPCSGPSSPSGWLLSHLLPNRDDRRKLWAPTVTSGLARSVFALCMLTPDFATMVVTLAATSFPVGFQLGRSSRSRRPPPNPACISPERAESVPSRPAVCDLHHG